MFDWARFASFNGTSIDDSAAWNRRQMASERLVKPKSAGQYIVMANIDNPFQ